MYKFVLKYPPSVSTLPIRLLSSKEKLKGYVFPEVKKEEVDQQIISGWGPGGQKVNTSINCVRLRHIPTNVFVKVHDSRSLEKNLVIAYERLKLALDRHLNKENCYEEQLKRLEQMRIQKLKRNRELKRQQKAEWKQELAEKNSNSEI